MTTSLSPVPANRDMLALQASQFVGKAKPPHVDCPGDPVPSTKDTTLLSDPASPNSASATTSEQQAALAQGATQLLAQPIDIMA